MPFGAPQSPRIQPASGQQPPMLSLVVPVFNEAPNLDRFVTRVVCVLEEIQLPYEIIFVDDGSSDDSVARVIAHRGKHPAVRLIELSRNFGKEAAMTAGIEHTRGQAVIPIDCDLQDPPELIKQLVAKWNEGFDVVYATRKSRQGETRIKQATAKLFYRCFNLIAKRPIPPDTGDFRLIDRKVVWALEQMPERTRFMKGLFAWVGFKQASVVYQREPRFAGSSKWNYWRLFGFAVDGIVSFSSLPVRVWTYVGGLMLLASGALTFWNAMLAVASTTAASAGWLSVLVLFVGGAQMVALGTVGEYVGRILEETKSRPLYLVAELHGFDDPHHSVPYADARRPQGLDPPNDSQSADAA